MDRRASLTSSDVKTDLPNNENEIARTPSSKPTVSSKSMVSYRETRKKEYEESIDHQGLSQQVEARSYKALQSTS